ncbi:hypothetical protein [Paraburkholderia bryophila]|uniref:Uncharacterized protein n=1 Tax=Paraburkholderia bryophila TaxID=420952 RepID=A0A7Y9WJG1_9BURK|nr:hypothetical protein [Paraburkholderia bryophila]NYH21390.1 hypothetical protein [Paraburkholderia bryophila]
MAELTISPKKMVKAVVARGRTVFDTLGKRHLAGEEIDLPAGEVSRLQARGFLVDPKEPVIPLDDGPTFGSIGGPRITRG